MEWSQHRYEVAEENVKNPWDRSQRKDCNLKWQSTRKYFFNEIGSTEGDINQRRNKETYFLGQDVRSSENHLWKTIRQKEFVFLSGSD